MKLGQDKVKASELVKQKWDVKHRTIFATEKLVLGKSLTPDDIVRPLKPSKAVMIKEGKEIPMYVRETDVQSE